MNDPLLGAGSDPDWFRRAVFYEVLIRSFKDSNGDGVGDIRGLAEKLEYIRWLGVDCIWLPPFFASPLRDGGYDVADYRGLQPEIGTMQDFRELLDEAHWLGLRVVGDFVMNHTSDQHEWFQQSRSDPTGPYGDFYVWSDTDDRYTEARVIFVDTESSNWTWDPVRGQYYWHRFYSHQPDLNFDNVAVQEALSKPCASGSTWAGRAAPRRRPVPLRARGHQLREPAGDTRLPQAGRKLIDDNYTDRVLLAEANQWPADVVDYFGDLESGGDECHMCFHFPVMPRIFMAVRRESRYPISEILDQTPDIPAHCQWGIFLRNHDELTLEMVSDEDRDYMWGEYAKDPRMKANIGIRRRLSPLLESDLNQIELFTALLLSLPGHPFSTTATRSAWETTSGSVTGRGTHPDAVDAGPQRRLLDGQPRAPRAAPGHGPRLRLPGCQRRSAAGERLLAAALDPADGPDPQAAPGVRHGSLPRPRRQQPQHLVLRPRVRRRRRAVRQQPLPLPAAGRARPAPLGGHRAGRAARRRPVPPHRRAALPAGPRRVRVLLVPARAGSGRDDRVTSAAEHVHSYLGGQRWFAGKGQPFQVDRLAPAGLAVTGRGGPGSAGRAVEVEDDGGARATYQLPLAYYPDPQERLSHAMVGQWSDPELGEVSAYDALHDRFATRWWLEALQEQRQTSDMSFHRLPAVELPLGEPSLLMTA
jgi:maltose alpha-D-glucosyltransferase/alpha-amylase